MSHKLGKRMRRALGLIPPLPKKEEKHPIVDKPENNVSEGQSAINKSPANRPRVVIGKIIAYDNGGDGVRAQGVDLEADEIITYGNKGQGTNFMDDEDDKPKGG